MAKLTKKYSFSKSEISNTDGKYILTEINKDDSVDYDFTAILDSFVGLSGVSISIGIDDDVPEIEV
jgi:hypothetical protein